MDLLPNHRSSKFLSRKHFLYCRLGLIWVILQETEIVVAVGRTHRSGARKGGCLRFRIMARLEPQMRKPSIYFREHPGSGGKIPKSNISGGAQATPRRRAALRYRPFIIPMERFTVSRASSSIGNYDRDLLRGKTRRERKADAQ
jgi:hypothetical protein